MASKFPSIASFDLPTIIEMVNKEFGPGASYGSFAALDAHARIIADLAPSSGFFGIWFGDLLPALDVMKQQMEGVAEGV